MTRSRIETSALRTIPPGTMRKDCRSIGPVGSSLRDSGHRHNLPDPVTPNLILSVLLFYHIVVISYFIAGTSKIRSQFIQVPELPAILCTFK